MNNGFEAMDWEAVHGTSGKARPARRRVVPHSCYKCGLRLDRDLNAARNILAQGLGNVKPVETKALAIGNGSETVVYEAGNVLKTQRA